MYKCWLCAHCAKPGLQSSLTKILEYMFVITCCMLKCLLCAHYAKPGHMTQLWLASLIHSVIPQCDLMG
jgi:hypothetical protein